MDLIIKSEAYVNPESPSRGSGYGLIRFDKAEQVVTFECWPREVDVTKGETEQFVGWPIKVSL